MVCSIISRKNIHQVRKLICNAAVACICFGDGTGARGFAYGDLCFFFQSKSEHIDGVCVALSPEVSRCAGEQCKTNGIHAFIIIKENDGCGIGIGSAFEECASGGAGDIRCSLNWAHAALFVVCQGWIR